MAARLQIDNAELFERVERIKNAEQIKQVAERIAVDAISGLGDLSEEVRTTIEWVRAGSASVSEIEKAEQRVDEIYWDLQDMVESGRATEAAQLSAFRAARAMSALKYSMAATDNMQLAEVVYEARHAGVDDSHLTKLLESR